jgi:hypothetical protein
VLVCWCAVICNIISATIDSSYIGNTDKTMQYYKVTGTFYELQVQKYKSYNRRRETWCRQIQIINLSEIIENEK